MTAVSDAIASVLADMGPDDMHDGTVSSFALTTVVEDMHLSGGSWSPFGDPGELVEDLRVTLTYSIRYPIAAVDEAHVTVATFSRPAGSEDGWRETPEAALEVVARTVEALRYEHATAASVCAVLAALTDQDLSGDLLTAV